MGLPGANLMAAVSDIATFYETVDLSVIESQQFVNRTALIAGS